MQDIEGLYQNTQNENGGIPLWMHLENVLSKNPRETKGDIVELRITETNRLKASLKHKGEVIKEIWLDYEMDDDVCEIDGYSWFGSIVVVSGFSNEKANLYLAENGDLVACNDSFSLGFVLILPIEPSSNTVINRYKKFPNGL